MSNMKNRTTVSVKEQDVKDDHGESWNDVIRFYAEHRDGLSLSDGGDADVSELEASIGTVEERTGRIEQTLEEMQR